MRLLLLPSETRVIPSASTLDVDTRLTNVEIGATIAFRRSTETMELFHETDVPLLPI